MIDLNEMANDLRKKYICETCGCIMYDEFKNFKKCSFCGSYDVIDLNE